MLKVDNIIIPDYSEDLGVEHIEVYYYRGNNSVGFSLTFPISEEIIGRRKELERGELWLIDTDKEIEICYQGLECSGYDINESDITIHYTASNSWWSSNENSESE